MACDLHLNRIKSISDIGNIDADIAFLAQYPSNAESKHGTPFSTVGWNKFFERLNDIGFNKDNAYFTYLIKCPIGDRETATYYKDLEINIHNCSNQHLVLGQMTNLKMIVALGNFSSIYLTNGYYNRIGDITSIGKYIIYHGNNPVRAFFDKTKENDFKRIKEVYQKYINPYHV